MTRSPSDRLRAGVLSFGLLWAPALWASDSGAHSIVRAEPEALGFSSERLERLSLRLERYVSDGQLAGGVTLVARRGQIVYEHAFGYRDLESQDAMDTSDVFRIASQTKAIVSVATMILQEEGRLLISDAVGKYLPEFSETTVAVAQESGEPWVVPAKRAITIRDLLTHTAGVDYGGVSSHWSDASIVGWYFADRSEPVRETVRRMAGLPFAAHPGERFVYGYSTDILGAVLEVAAEQPLDELLEDRLFGPLGMSSTSFYLPAGSESRLTTVYSSVAGGGLERAPAPGHMVGQGHYAQGPRTSFSGGAGLLSTAADYARFLLMMEGDGALGEVRILSPASVRLMTSNHVGDLFGWRGGSGFGLGFSVLEDLGERGTLGTEGEFAWGGAYHTTYWVDPELDLVVVYMTQLIPALGIDDHEMIRTLVYSALLDP